MNAKAGPERLELPRETSVSSLVSHASGKRLLLLTWWDINPRQFHVCGNTWEHLSDLLADRNCVGTVAAWIVAVGSEWQELPTRGDSLEELTGYGLSRLAAEMAGCDESDIDALEGLAYVRCLEALLSLIRKS